MDVELIIWTAFAASLSLSFLLSGMEAGVFALSRLRIRQQMRAGKPSARILHEHLDHPETFLWTILVGNTIANLFILGWAFMVLHRYVGAHPRWFAVTYATGVFLFFTLFDLLPKSLFRLFPNRLCMFLARPFRFVHTILRPLVLVVESASNILVRWTGGRAFTGRLFGNREELRFVMQESTQTLTSEERAMISRVLDFQSITVSRAMKPMADVVTIEEKLSARQALALCRSKGYTRFPVWGERDRKPRIIGFVSCNALLYPSEMQLGRPIKDFVKPALFLDEDTRLEVALRKLQRAGQRMAIVLGRDRKEVGIVTLQDLIRVIFGEVSL